MDRVVPDERWFGREKSRNHSQEVSERTVLMKRYISHKNHNVVNFADF